MDPHPALQLSQQPLSLVKQQQRLMMLPHMQQGLHLLQIPILELEAWLDEAINQNPLLEKSEDEGLEAMEHASRNDYRPSLYKQRGNFYPTRNQIEGTITDRPSLFTHLMQQAHQTFTSHKDLQLAETLIGHFDERGFLTTPLSEMDGDQGVLEKLLGIIQQFEPYGVGARSIQESLLIQLCCLGKQSSLAYRIVNHHYQELLHNQLPTIQKALKCPLKMIVAAIEKDIAVLDLRPGSRFSLHFVPYIVPDAKIMRDGETFSVEINNERLPSLKLHPEYVKLYKDYQLNKETRQFIHEQIHDAQWLIHNLQHRNDTLLRVIEILIKRHHSFFSGTSNQLSPLTMQEVAVELNLHLSTVTRAVANKYIHCEHGIYSLRSFFSSKGLRQGKRPVEDRSLMAIIKQLIDQENKYNPYSDADLVNLLKAQGIVCARRTITKYRHLLQIGNCRIRRQFTS